MGDIKSYESAASVSTQALHVSGPESAVDQHVAVFDDTTGKQLADGGMSVQEIIDAAKSESGDLTQAAADARYASLVHAARHASGGADAIKLDDLAAPDDNTDLNVSTARHGLAPKGDNDPTHFLNGQGAWTAAGDVKGPATNEDHNVPQFKGADSKEVEDSGYTVAEIIAAGAAAAPQGDVVGPAGAEDNNLVVFDGVTGKAVKDSGKTVAEVIADALSAAGTGDVVGPAGATADHIPQFDGVTGKVLKDGLAVVTTIGTPGADTAVPTEQAVREAIAAVPIGDVTAGATINDNVLVRGDGGAKGVQKSGITVDDSDNTVIPGTLRAKVTITANGALSGALTLLKTSDTYQTANPNGSDRDVTLPSVVAGDKGLAFCICNVGSANKLTVKNAAAATVCEVNFGESRNVIFDGSAWVAI